MLTENDILAILSTHLSENGYTEIETLTTQQKGIDLKAKAPDGIQLLVEAKGETSSKEDSNRFGQPFSGNQIWTHVSVALVKTLMTMNEHDEHFAYGMAFPENHRIMLQKLKAPLDKLGIIVFIVFKDKVEIL